LLIVFCIIWQDGGGNTSLMNNNGQAFRMFISATIGICMFSVISVLKQKNLYANETNALVAMVLISALVVYMYIICKQYLGILIDEENKGLNKNTHRTNYMDIVKKMKED